ncbi:MAG: hypothetical protein PVH88_22605 [Ignavibacteria bacterium]
MLKALFLFSVRSDTNNYLQMNKLYDLFSSNISRRSAYVNRSYGGQAKLPHPPTGEAGCFIAVEASSQQFDY